MNFQTRNMCANAMTIQIMKKLKHYFHCKPPSLKVKKIIEEQTVGQTDGQTDIVDLVDPKNKNY